MQRLATRACLLVATLLIAACAHKTGATGLNDTQNGTEGTAASFWAGRISLQLQSEPPQAFFAGFELTGRASSGQLSLISPLGTILGVMRWSPAEAVLEQGGVSKRFASTDELLAQTTGAAIPLPALFDWLRGVNTPAPGWNADLSQHSAGRISAKRTAPAPQAELRLVLDK